MHNEMCKIWKLRLPTTLRFGKTSSHFETNAEFSRQKCRLISQEHLSYIGPGQYFAGLSEPVADAEDERLSPDLQLCHAW